MAWQLIDIIVGKICWFCVQKLFIVVQRIYEESKSRWNLADMLTASECSVL